MSKNKSKYYEINNTINYKRRYIDFNEYGFNKYEQDYPNYLEYSPKND